MRRHFFAPYREATDGIVHHSQHLAGKPLREKALEYGAAAFGFFAAYVLFRLPTDMLIVKVAWGALGGLLVGLLPYILAKRWGKESRGNWALGICAAAGAAAGLLLAVPTAIALTLMARSGRSVGSA